MTKYICKCGRVVAKSTSADNTGNRDTENCKGCPYLLPWGPTQWDATRHAMVTDVKGYECRMSPSLDYATYYQGGGEDKCVLHIYSLDYDFLDRVTAWAAKQFPDKEISCSFDRSKIRATEFIGGLYGMSVYPMQNKKGMAAKAALIERFFGPDGHRLDKTPEEEKAIVLASIEAGKAKVKTQERKKTMDYIISKHEATGRLYAYYKGSFWFWDSHIQRWLLSQFAEDLYQEERPKRWNFEREHFLAQTSDFHQLDDYEVSPNCIETLLQCNPKTAIPAPASAESPEIVDECSEPNCTCSDCKRQDCTCAGGCDASGRGKCDGEKNCAQDGCTYTAKHQENPTDAAPVSPVDAGAAAQSLSNAEPVSLAADLPDVCQSCQCATCGNEDCPTPCFQKDDEVQECKKLGPMGDDCEYYQPKEDAECLKTPAPNGDAAATSDESAARMCEGPDEETRTTPAAASGAALESLHAQSALPQNAPAQDIAADAPSAQAFDYSGLDKKTAATLHAAERLIFEARRDYVTGLANAVHIAHEALCGGVVQNLDNSKHGNRGDDAFASWCASVGLKRSTAYNLLQVNALLSGATAEEQATLEAASPSLLYAAAKPSAPAELVQAVKDGEITTHKQYQEALAEIKARDAKIQELLEMSEGADRRADAADARAKKAEQERDAARDAQANLSAMANKFSKQRDAAEQRVEDAEQRAAAAERRAQAAEAEVKSWEADGQKMQEIVDDQQAVIEEQKARIGELESGITVETTAADQEEIERRANELSEPLVKIINQKDEQIERMASGNTVAVQASVLEQYIESMKASLLGNASCVELACYDVRALDSLAEALREFADSIDGIFEDRSEDND